MQQFSLIIFSFKNGGKVALLVKIQEKYLKNQTVQLFLRKKTSTYYKVLHNSHTNTAWTWVLWKQLSLIFLSHHTRKQVITSLYSCNC